MTERRRVLVAFWIVGFLLTVGICFRYVVKLAPCCGIYSRNFCGTYDRWLTWGDGALRFPNGWAGRRLDACRGAK